MLSQKKYIKQLEYLKNRFKFWTSGNEKIDNFIQERKMEIDEYDDVVFEWIPYSQFNQIKKTGKNNLMTTYSAIWIDGPHYWDQQHYEYIRNSNKEVALKCLHNSQNRIEFVINEV
jgi:hypothetical protein